MTAAEAVVGARYRVTGGRVIHVVGVVGKFRITPMCRSAGGSSYRGDPAGFFRAAHLADPMHLARWPMCAECERRAEVKE